MQNKNLVNTDASISSFENKELFGQWLAQNFNLASGIWIRVFKKQSNITSINCAQALEEALCFGWIDGQRKSYDDISFLQKYTPRRKNSLWSKRNVAIVEQLIKEGKMQSSGLIQVAEAKADGRWQRAYDSSSNMQVPQYFLDELTKNKKAKTFFDTLNKTNVYAIVWRLQTAKKEETRIKRMQLILEMLTNEKKFH